MGHDGTVLPFPCVHVAQTSQGSQQVHMNFDPLNWAVGGFKAGEALRCQLESLIFSHSAFPSSGAM